MVLFFSPYWKSLERLQESSAVCTQSKQLCVQSFTSGCFFETLGDLLNLPVPEIELLS